MSKIIGALTCGYISMLLACHTVYAACPVCAVGVAGCVVVSKYFGIDDTILGLWLGALIASFVGMTVLFLNKMHIRFIGRKPLVAAIYLVSVIWPLYYKNYIGLPGNTLWGIDKMILGLGLGIVIFCCSFIWYAYLKQKNNNHAYFPLQKVCMPIGLLLIMSFVLYCITK